MGLFPPGRAVGMSQYYVVACFLHWPETMGQRAITRHSQTGYIVAKRMPTQTFGYLGSNGRPDVVLHRAVWPQGLFAVHVG